MSSMDKSKSPALFNAISKRYDLLNLILSFGLDRGWRKKILDTLPPGERLRVLDLATGTADVAILLAQQGEHIAEVVGIDLAQNMLEIGQAKVFQSGLAAKIRLLKADAQYLPFADSAFDVVTIAFGLRNMPDLMRSLIEAERVLVPGGRLIILEFSKPDGIVKPLHAFYLHYLMPLVGCLLTFNFEAYHYLSRTVGGFPYGQRLLRILAQAGLRRGFARRLFLGTATIYCAEKKR